MNNLQSSARFMPPAEKQHLDAHTTPIARGRRFMPSGGGSKALPLAVSVVFVFTLSYAPAVVGSELERYHEIRKCLDEQDFDKADELLESALKEYPDSLRLKSMHYLFYAYLSRTDRKLDAARHAEADMNLWLTRIQETPGTASMLTQKVDTVTNALLAADEPELAQQKMDQTIERVTSIADGNSQDEFAILLTDLKVRKAILLTGTGQQEEGHTLMESLSKAAKQSFDQAPEKVINILAMASVLSARASMVDSTDEKKAAQQDLLQFLMTQAKLHSDSNLVVSRYLDAQLSALDELVEEDALAAQQQLGVVEDFLASIESGDTGVQSIVRNAARPIDDIRRHIAIKRHIDRTQVHQSLIGQKAIPIDADAWVNGSQLTGDDLQGKVVLLDFWAVWCGPCIVNFPHLQVWHDKFADQGLIIVGVTQYYRYDWDDENDQVKAVKDLSPTLEQAALAKLAKHYQLRYRFAVMPEGSDLSDKYGVSDIPQAVLIDRKGIVRMIHVGSDDENVDKIEQMIEQLLAEPAT